MTSAIETGLPSDDKFSAALRGFGPLGIVAILAILLSGNVFVGPMIALPIGAALVLVWRSLSRTPWSAIGYVRPRSWILTAAAGITFGVAFKFAMKAVVMPLVGAPAINPTYHFLAGNRAMLPAAIWAMFVAGFGEETVFRGWMFERLGKLLGSTVAVRSTIVILTSILFGLGHYMNQGIPGVEQAAIVGLVLGTIFAMTGRVFMLMIAHAAFDLTALWMIYCDLETHIAHLVFK
ncbi:MAG: CPBP family intramembrane metalloprotease [Acidobacteriota bacterium]|nr:CPBP family intramembrane metalloprotease [Acidobacteriota bacterium]